jgi:hypothetical protein
MQHLQGIHKQVAISQRTVEPPASIDALASGSADYCVRTTYLLASFACLPVVTLGTLQNNNRHYVGRSTTNCAFSQGEHLL